MDTQIGRQTESQLHINAIDQLQVKLNQISPIFLQKMCNGMNE